MHLPPSGDFCSQTRVHHSRMEFVMLTWMPEDVLKVKIFWYFCSQRQIVQAEIDLCLVFLKNNNIDVLPSAYSIQQRQSPCMKSYRTYHE